MLALPRTGRFANNLPYALLGSGPRPLIIFPGINDALYDPTVLGWFYNLYYLRYGLEHTVYVIGRRRHLPAGYATADMARDYAVALRDAVGPADVVGFSLGGLVAQHFAADFPELTRRLVIADAAARIGAEGQHITCRWIALAQGRRWHELYIDMAGVSYVGVQRQFYTAWMQLYGQFLVPQSPNPHDLDVLAAASVAHDSTGRLSDIQAPTLLIGGMHDRLFPPDLIRETAQRIPRARVQLLNGAGHNASDERKCEFDAIVLQFLRG